MFLRRFLVVLVVGGLLVSRPVSNVSAATPCNWAQFVTDVSVPDGSLVAPGAVFTKIWRVKNIGTCTWTTSYSLVFDSGSQMSGASPTNLPKSIAPGQTIDLAVILAAPTSPGRYRGFWKLSDAAGVRFGMGTAASGAFWADVEVQDSSAVAYDLVAFAPYAAWKSGAGLLPFPGTSGDYRGYAQRLDSLTTEDGAFTTAPSLVTVPQNRFDGYIQGVYPEFSVQKGDRFQAAVGCEYGSSCYVTYRLDYMNSAGVGRSFWTRKEMNDGRVYQANIDLSPLAGQTVRFVLSVLATGSPEHDRAIWGAPRIVRTIPPGTPVTPLSPPVLTPTPTPFENPPVISPSACDKATFVYDVTVPDGTYFAPGAAFSKTWRLKNSGSCTWKTSYRALFYSGEQMGAPTSVNLPASVSPGQTLDLTINMVAPQEAGLHRGNWVLSNAEGVLFGTGSPAVNPFWLQVNVSGATLSTSGYDFAGNVCAAQWRNGSGALPCPGTDGDIKGFVIEQDAPHLEDGTFATLPGLLVAPQFKYGGYIQGTYPAFTVQAGDRFQAMVGCEYKAPCYVSFRLDYMTAAGTVKNFWSWTEKNESRFRNADVDLSPLAGQSVRLILVLSAAGYPNGDRAIWAAPHIQRPVVNLPSTPTPTPTPTFLPPGGDWLTYTDAKYSFQFKYPKEAQITDQNDAYVKLMLPFTAGTNLKEKYLEVQVSENANPCQSPLDINGPPRTSETVIINGISFLKETGEDGGVGHLHQWVAYSTVQGTTCVSLDFVLHSLNPGVFPTMPPVFNMEAESAVFGQIVATYSWLGSTPTPTATLPPVGDDWLTGGANHIRFKYPSQSQIVNQSDTYVKIALPFTPGTNLQEKYLEVLVSDNANSCSSTSNGPPQSSETVTINGISFLKETGGDAATSNIYEWVAYSTMRKGVCASFSFVLHSINPGVYTTPPPVFDRAAESVVFGQIMNTFLWMIPPDWLDYTDSRYGFNFQFPAQAQIVNQSDTYVKFELPIVPGTNLYEKYLEVLVSENLNPCRSTINGPGQTSETVTINGISFLKETAKEALMSKLYDWVAYSTARDSVCVSFSFLLHSVALGAYATPPPAFDRAAESQIFGQIINTFAWMTPTATPAPLPTDTPTATPTGTQPPAGSNWLTYTSARYGFQFQYSGQGQLTDQLDNYLKVTIPFTAGTNLLEKYLQVYVAENVNPCQSPLSTSLPPHLSETVVINGTTFLRESGMEGVTGQTYQWIAYSTARGAACVTFNFVLHSRNPGNYPTPPVLFDEAAESTVFEQMMGTFIWLGPTDTPTPIPSATDTPVATSTYTPTLPPAADDWLTYNNPRYGFNLQYPKDGQILSQLDTFVKIALPFTVGTNLVEKHLQAYVAENVTPCRSPLGYMLPVQSSETVVINGASFLKESGTEGVAGQVYEWIAYSNSRDTSCVSLNFILHSSSPATSQTPPPPFDAAAEKAVFEQIVATFTWLGPAITPVPSDTPTPVPSETPTPVLTGVPLPDLAISQMRLELEYTACLLPDHPFGVRIWIVNNGPVPASGFTVRLGDVEQAVAGLAAGETTTVFFKGDQYDGTTVTATVDSTSQVAESDETNNSRTEMVWVPTPPVPCTPTPTPPVALIGPYAVTLVNPGDVLNIRSDAGASNPIVGSFSGDAVNVMRTGRVTSADGADWAEVVRPDGGTGWVNSLYLTEYVTHEAFCADSRVPSLINQLKLAMDGSDGILFAGLVSPNHGVRVNYWRSGAQVDYTKSTAQTIFADSAAINWGSGPSVTPDIGTFAQIVQPDLTGVLDSAYQLSCDDPSYARMFVNPWPYLNIHYYAVVKPATTGNDMDWRVWLLGFEYVDRQPYLFGTVHYIWEP